MPELHNLCAELDIEQAISLHRKADTIEEIVTHVETTGRSADLMRVCRQLRPHVNWPEASDPSSNQWLPHTSFDEIDAIPKGLESQTPPPSSPLVLGESDDQGSFGLESTSLSLDLVSLEYSVFERWNIETNQNMIADTLVVQALPATHLQSGTQPPARATLPAEIAVFTREAIGSPDKYPLFVRVAWPSSRGDEAASAALVLWPASLSGQPLNLLPDSDPGINTDAPLLLASVKSGDNAVDALLGYIHSGALTAAQQMAPAMITRAENFLYAKQSQPLYAIIAAYALLKVGSANRLNWIANLADWFPLLTDGAIIYGWYLIRNGEAEQARRYFRQALEHGLPMYTEGIRLLRDGLRFVSGLYPDDIDLQHDAALAYRIATAANFESVLTCLRLGHGLGMNHI
ncbi:MAG: hypothetical protein M3R61_07980 [Chloroflexota bacterium]|nr:hypothetical protein [Chloroflexota bacterium]